MSQDLHIIHYPDPRLRKISADVKIFDQALADLAGRMFELMRAAKGVGLAAPQVGKNIRLFIANPTGEPKDDQIYVNPLLFDADGEETAEEGCLSLPKINVQVLRAKSVRLQAHDQHGKPFEITASGYLPRIWQHELDHLNGVLLLDRMSPTEKIEYRKIVKELEQQYEADHPTPKKKRGAHK